LPQMGYLSLPIRGGPPEASFDRLASIVKGVGEGRRYAASRPTPSETTPAASDSAPIQTSQMSRLGCWMSPLPAEDTKNPADIRIAANGTPERAAQPARPCSVVASASTWQMRPRLTSTPACAWPARAND